MLSSGLTIPGHLMFTHPLLSVIHFSVRGPQSSLPLTSKETRVTGQVDAEKLSFHFHLHVTAGT